MTNWLEVDPLDAEVIRREAATRWLGRSLELHRALPSTMDRVRAAIAAGASPGLTVLAEEQTRGRGRQGRPWRSPAGCGLWMTMLIDRADVAPGVLTLSLAVAVRNAIVAAGGPTVDIKWPNDLEVDRRKLCGILVEAVGDRLAAAGIGVNVHPEPIAPPPSLNAIALDETSTGIMVRNRLAARVLEAVEATLTAIGEGRVHELLDAWRRACPYLGRRVRIDAAGPSAEGTALDVDGDGALVIRRADGGTEHIVAGTLRCIDAEEDPTST